MLKDINLLTLTKGQCFNYQLINTPYNGDFRLSTQLIKTNYIFNPPPPPPLPSNAASQLFLKLPPFYFLTSLMMIYASGKTVDTKDGFSQIRLFTVNYMLIYFWKNHFS